ncbi:MAG: DUF177 domain-containing protein [Alphaproteobacteria bacterium]|nr:DUF177 domain-containing protein [Alphaproteobacteria bacterium]
MIRLPEFSRLVPLVRLGPHRLRTEIEATVDERRALARRFDLVTLDRLSAVVTLQRLDAALIRLEAEFDAEFAQTCVITLDPVPGRLAQSFSLLYGPNDVDAVEIEIGGDEPVFEPLTGDAIDIAEAVAQELSLALPEFPRLPDAVVDQTEITESQPGQFAALERLFRPLPS